MLGNNSHEQLINLFNSIFCKESLRKNVYIFNSLNQHLQISIRTIAKQRRVLQITNNIQTIILALKECPFVKVLTPNSVKILMKGDEVVVKLSSNEGKKIYKKDIQEIAKHMKFEVKQTHQHFQIQFQSHAATIQFIERLKSYNLNYQYQILQKNPYKCLQESIGNIRKEKRNIKQKYGQQTPYTNQNYLPYEINHFYQQLPIFIRRSVPSSDQQVEYNAKEKPQAQKKYVEKTKLDQQARLRFNSQDFPTFDKLNINQPTKDKPI